jgi:hypothetical protein
VKLLTSAVKLEEATKEGVLVVFDFGIHWLDIIAVLCINVLVGDIMQ